MQRRHVLLRLFAALWLLVGVQPAVGWSFGGSQPNREHPTGTTLNLRGLSHNVPVIAVDVPERTSQGARDESSAFHKCARVCLAVFAVLAVVVSGVPRPAQATEDNVDIYFGQGCFWHVQHEFAKTEAAVFQRKGSEVTALVGYAGGTKVGDKGNVCYHNMAFAPDYGDMGHTEVVNVKVPESKVGEIAKGYIEAAVKYPFGRADPQDRGTEYRSAIGLPGGMDSPLFKQIEQVNEGRLKFLRGNGGDRDTIGTKNVFVYDSKKFPFYQGEVYHQFHDDMGERYSDAYHKLKDVMLSNKTLKQVECPEFGF